MIDGDHEYLDTALEAANRAATILRERFDTDVTVEYKSSTDLVSEIDLEAEKVIKQYIAEQHPDHAYFAEESGREGDSDHRWIIDPLDGTHNYLNGFSHYCVSVALKVERDIQVGVVNYPATDDVYAAVAGQGAYCNGRPLSVTSVEALSESFLGMGVSAPTAGDEQFLQLFHELFRNERTQGIRRLGAGAADLSFVSRGVFDGFFDKYTSPWDVAAGVLLVEEAGGTVTDYAGDQLDFGVGGEEIELVATNGDIHDDLVELYAETPDGLGF